MISARSVCEGWSTGSLCTRWFGLFTSYLCTSKTSGRHSPNLWYNIVQKGNFLLQFSTKLFSINHPWIYCTILQGAAIIRMMDSFLGRDTFQKGLTVSVKLQLNHDTPFQFDKQNMQRIKYDKIILFKVCYIYIILYSVLLQELPERQCLQ